MNRTQTLNEEFLTLSKEHVDNYFNIIKEITILKSNFKMFVENYNLELISYLKDSNI